VQGVCEAFIPKLMVKFGFKNPFWASHRHSCTDGGEILRGRVAMHAASLLLSDGFVEEGPRDATNTKTVISHSRYAINWWVINC